MRATQLRFALLASLGALPLGCGGSTLGEGEQGQKCSSPQTDAATGLVTCGEGFTHRPTAITCAADAPTSGDAPLSRIQPGTGPECESDPAVCELFQYGYCQGGQFGPTCASGCAIDDDCGAGQICLCDGAANGGRCEYATCRTNADCEPGYHCASYTNGVANSYACQTPHDSCRTDSDCKGNESCQVQADSGRQCAPRAVAGRPFLVAREVRFAPVVRRADWLA